MGGPRTARLGAAALRRSSPRGPRARQLGAYGKSFVADKSLIIGVVPVGYADGFRRSLGEGHGGVYVHDTYCQTVGRVCMDMIMIDLSQLDDVQKGDNVEIIGRNQSVEDFAEKLNTIPYEVMTSFSKRVPRVYIED